eukprot:GSA25T00005570001.1
MTFFEQLRVFRDSCCRERTSGTCSAAEITRSSQLSLRRRKRRSAETITQNSKCKMKSVTSLLCFS